MSSDDFPFEKFYRQDPRAYDDVLLSELAGNAARAFIALEQAGLTSENTGQHIAVPTSTKKDQVYHVLPLSPLSPLLSINPYTANEDYNTDHRVLLVQERLSIDNYQDAVFFSQESLEEPTFRVIGKPPLDAVVNINTMLANNNSSLFDIAVNRSETMLLETSEERHNLDARIEQVIERIRPHFEANPSKRAIAKRTELQELEIWMPLTNNPQFVLRSMERQSGLEYTRFFAYHPTDVSPLTGLSERVICELPSPINDLPHVQAINSEDIALLTELIDHTELYF